MMYRGAPGTGTPIMDFAVPPKEGPILGYSHRQIANLYAYANNNPINNIDPSGTTVVFSSGEGANKFAAKLKELGATNVMVENDAAQGFFHVFACRSDADAIFKYADQIFPDVFKRGSFIRIDSPARAQALRRTAFLLAIMFNPTGDFSDADGNDVTQIKGIDFAFDQKVMAGISRALRKCNEETPLIVDIGGEGGKDPARVNCNIRSDTTATPIGPIPRLVPKTDEIPSPFPKSTVDFVYIEGVPVPQNVFNGLVLDAARIVKSGGKIILLNPSNSGREFHAGAIAALEKARYRITVSQQIENDPRAPNNPRWRNLVTTIVVDK